jgi:hypothetical protein
MLDVEARGVVTSINLSTLSSLSACLGLSYQVHYPILRKVKINSGYHDIDAQARTWILFLAYHPPMKEEKREARRASIQLPADENGTGPPFANDWTWELCFSRSSSSAQPNPPPNAKTTHTSQHPVDSSPRRLVAIRKGMGRQGMSLFPIVSGSCIPAVMRGMRVWCEEPMKPMFFFGPAPSPSRNMQHEHPPPLKQHASCAATP